MIPIVVLISGSGTNLQQIIDKCHGKTVNIEAVISDDDHAYGLQRALDAGISAITCIQTFETREEYCETLIDVVKRFEPRFVILAGFMKILTPNFVNSFDNIMNIHPALLPKYPGLHTHQRAIDAGDHEHGITIHWVDEGVDTGPIIHQATCPIYPGDTAEVLEERVHKLEHYWYPNIIDYHAIMANATDKLY